MRISDWSSDVCSSDLIPRMNKEILMATAHVFIATSLDGFIARPDGDIDWLLQRDDQTEDHGYSDFIADKDVIVMGRDRKCVVWGKSESGRVDLVGRRIINKNNKKRTIKQCNSP